MEQVEIKGIKKATNTLCACSLTKDLGDRGVLPALCVHIGVSLQGKVSGCRGAGSRKQGSPSQPRPDRMYPAWSRAVAWGSSVQKPATGQTGIQEPAAGRTGCISQASEGTLLCTCICTHTSPSRPSSCSAREGKGMRLLLPSVSTCVPG